MVVVYVMVWCSEVCRVGRVARAARLWRGVVGRKLAGVAVVLGHRGVGAGRDGGVVVLLVVPRPLAGSACMVVLAWRGRVLALVAGWAVGSWCCGKVVAVGVGGGGAIGVLRDPSPGWGAAPCWRARWRAP